MQCKTARTKAQRRSRIIGENGKPRKRAKRCQNTAMQDGLCHWCLMARDRARDRRDAFMTALEAVNQGPLPVELVWGATDDS